jgi:hypothetical protein
MVWLALALGLVQAAPERYTGNATATVMFVDPDAVQKTCMDAGAVAPEAGKMIVGCQPRLGPFEQKIIVPNPCNYKDDPYAVLLCHELGHWNGWPSDHPTK